MKSRQHILNKSLTAFLIATFLLVGGVQAQAVTVSATDVVISVGETGKTTVKVDTLPDGLAGYIISLSISPSDSASFTCSGGDQKGITFLNPGTAGNVDSCSANSIKFRDTDFGGNVEPGATDVDLAQVQLTRDKAIEGTITLSVERLETDDAEVINPNTENGKITSSLQLVSPNGGENWKVGTEHQIKWESAEGLGPVKLEYSTDNGNNWATIIGTTENDGVYSWTIPDKVSDDCLVKVISTRDTTVSDSSDGAFTIPMTVKATDITLAPGSTTPTTVGVDKLPDGLSGYIVTLKIIPTKVALFSCSGGDQKGVTFLNPGSAGKVDSCSSDSITFRDTDFGGKVEPGATSVDLAKVRVTDKSGADSISSGKIGIQVDRLEEDDGDIVEPAVDTGKVQKSGETFAIPYVVSHWNPDQGKLNPNDDPTIDMDEILLAISWWANDTQVPKTGGKTIDMDKILKLINYWAEGKEITETM